MTAINVLVGELLSGRITATIPVTGMRWTDVLNNNGSIEVTIPPGVVRDNDLRQLTDSSRCFLAVERDGRIKQAGPIWSRTYEWRTGELSLGAQGVWSWLDRRIIRSIDTPSVIATDLSLGGIARGLVQLVTGAAYSDVPIVLPPPEAGDHTETFFNWQLHRYGEQLKQITQRAVDAPDIHFQPRRTAADPRYIEWVMQVGTEATPSLSQGGLDWVLDTSAPRSPVLGISTDEDATQMAEQVFVTGNGQEESILIAYASDATLLDLGWPLLEADESRSTVEVQATLQGHADSFLVRSARPIEVFKVAVRADAASEILPGDFVRLITRGDVWLGDMDRTMRVKEISGDLSDTVNLTMFPMAAAL